MKKIFIVNGNPDSSGITSALTLSYESGAKTGGHDARSINLGDSEFDPVLHKGYKEVQELEPALVEVRENIKWADHIVIFYPNWWGTMPALLKGMFERVLLPGFAFSFGKGDGTWEKLLEGRSAHVFVTMDNDPKEAREIYGDCSDTIKKAMLEFCGISPVTVSELGPIRTMNEEEKENLKEKMSELGRKAE